MDRLDLWILSVLQFNDADNYLVAMSISEILQEEHDTTRMSLYKHLKRLNKKKYVATGPRDNKAHSYYITERGKEVLFNIGVIRQIKCCLIPQIKNNFLRYAEALRSVLFAVISAHCFT